MTRSRRQNVRTSLLLISVLLFPITLYYFSPYLIIMGLSEGVINGSFLVFAGMFVVSLFVGRFWCGWLCPAGGLMEFGEVINSRDVKKGRWVKWAIWIPWMALIVFTAIKAGGVRSVNPLYQLDGGLTLMQPFWFIIYYFVLAIFLGLSALFGRRGGCHYICWMAPFMIIGRKIRNGLRTPALHLKADPDKCTSCLTCTKNCPMSLEVNAMVQRGDMEHADCILCGTCVDGCSSKAIVYALSRGRH